MVMLEVCSVILGWVCWELCVAGCGLTFLGIQALERIGGGDRDRG